MADNQVLPNSRFYLEIDGMTELVVKKVSGLQVTLEAAGDMKSFGVTKGGKVTCRQPSAASPVAP